MRKHILCAAAAVLLAAPASAVTIDWVFVGDAGNAPDTASNCFSASCGSVAYDYAVSKYEITNAQYAEFLDAKAASDPLSLYATPMNPQSNPFGGITRSGSAGRYTYAAAPGSEDHPVNFVSFVDAVRFANWLHNGQGSGDTETGAYTLLGGGPFPGNYLTVTRNPGATIVLPTENEWYKAAFYDGASGVYYDFPAGSNAEIVCAAPTSTGNRANCEHAGDGLTDVGAYTGSASPYGTFDQGGNVGERVEDIVPGGTERGHRGGTFSWGSDSLAASGIDGLDPASQFAIDPISQFANFGFRVVLLVPEPGTTLLLMSALLGLLRRVR